MKRAEASRRLGLRRPLWIGVGVQFIGMAWDGVWHRANPGSEGVADMAVAHIGIYLGIVITLVAAARAVALTATRLGLAYRGFSIVFIASVLQVVGHGWDVWAHATGAEAARAHGLAFIGLILVVVGLLVTGFLRTESEQPTQRGPRGSRRRGRR
jgi:uncharacterized membrane protein